MIISPTFNEVDNIQKFIDAVFQNDDLSLLIVDDNSPDGTGEIVKENMLKNKNLYLIERNEKRGLGTAYIAILSGLWNLNISTVYKWIVTSLTDLRIWIKY